MADPMDMPLDQFQMYLREVADMGGDVDTLVRQYRRNSSAFSGLLGAADQNQADMASQGRRSVGGGLLSKESGTTGMDALRSVQFEPRAFLTGLLGAGANAFDAPRAAYDGLIPEQDMTAEALGTAGFASLGGAAATAPQGSLRAGLARAGDAPTPAMQVAELLRNNRAADVTDDMMARVDPQEMFRLYEQGATGADMPMDAASRMARAEGMGFDTGTPLYHGTGADFQAFSPKYRGGVADAYTARRADWFTDSPLTAQGYTDMATRDAPVARLIKQSEAAERAGKWDLANELMVQAERLEQNMPDASGQMIIPSMTPKPRQSFDADGMGPNDMENSMRDQLTAAQKSGDSGMELQNFSDHPDFSVDDPSLHRGIFDPSNIRSQFARFDPRLSHLSNLSAANVSPTAGLLGAAVAQEQQALPFQKFLRGLFE